MPSTRVPARSSAIVGRSGASTVTRQSWAAARTPRWRFTWSHPGTVNVHMADVIWTDRPKLRSPIMVCAFKGWNDAGEAASAALSFIRGTFESEEVARIDPEEFYDFTAVRPTVRLSAGRTRVIEWPENSLHAAQVSGAEHDLLLLQGVEPSLRWKQFTGLVVDLAREFDAHMVITLGALLADVPH